MSHAPRKIPVFPEFAKQANINLEQYRKLYRESLDHPETFWPRMAERLTWQQKWNKLTESDFQRGTTSWFIGGKLNATINCLDRHLNTIGEKTAIIWEGDNPEESSKFTYREVHQQTCIMANVLRQLGAKKGDRVLIYMPMIPELAFAVLACARIGAIHSVVFGGFSPDSIMGRMDDCHPKLIITSDGGYRGGKTIDMKANVDAAMKKSTHKADKVLVVKRTGQQVGKEPWDVWYDDAKSGVSSDCEPEIMDAEDPLFILYTSGSTGKPKGVLHTTAGYLLGASLTHHYVFDHKENDIFWCTADIGWVTGHSYILYGPLCNGATTLMFEGVPSWPDFGRFWDVVDKYKVTVFYTAPTAIRALSAQGTSHFKGKDLSSLRLLGSVGEPINPEAWEWYFENAGKSRCPIVDTWWQTETGSIMITPLPGATELKPGSGCWPFFGVEPVLVDEKGQEIPGEGEASGYLCIKRAWPSMIRGVYGDPERVFATYFSQYPGKYFTGDGCHRDADGYYWITGRVDDVLNVSGHRIGTAEVESALVAHELVAEAAVVGYPHSIKGQGIYAYVTLQVGTEGSDQIRIELTEEVIREIGKIAKPEVIHFTPALPKTRSGKIMRRILRKIAEGEYNSLGDISTLADPGVVQSLVDLRKTLKL